MLNLASELWQKVFDDGEFSLDFFKHREAYLEHYYRLNPSGTLISQAFTVKTPAKIKGESLFVNLIVGVDTADDYRKQGLASSLINEIKSKSDDYPLVLYPAVREFYASLGFTSEKAPVFEFETRELEVTKDYDQEYLNWIYEASSDSLLLRDEWSWQMIREENDVILVQDAYALCSKLTGKIIEATAANERGASLLFERLSADTVCIPSSPLETFLTKLKVKRKETLKGMTYPTLNMYIAEQY